MNMKQMFNDMHEQLVELAQQYNQKKLSASSFQKELRKFSQQSEMILDEWIQFEDHLHEYTLQAPHKESEPHMPQWEKATAYYDLMMFGQAIIPLQEVVQSHPEFERARLYLAHAYLATEQLSSAKYQLQFLMDTSDTEEVYHLCAHGLGCISGTLGAYDHARRYFDKIDLDQVRDEWKPIFVYNHGQTLFKLKQYEESREKFLLYNEYVADDWRGFFFLGKIEHELGHQEDGFAYWFSALQKEEHPHLLKALAEQFEQRTFYQMASQCYERLFKGQNRSKDVEVWFGLAWCEGLAGNRKKSEQTYVKALSLFPNHVQLQMSYVWMLLYWGETSKAEAKVEKLKQILGDHPLLEGLEYMMDGAYSRAREYLTQQK